MSVGQQVVVVISPYSSVRVGTVATIERIRLNHFGPRQHLYELSGVEHKLFREYELSAPTAGQERE
jgi:hypothetical protein